MRGVFLLYSSAQRGDETRWNRGGLKKQTAEEERTEGLKEERTSRDERRWGGGLHTQRGELKSGRHSLGEVWERMEKKAKDEQKYSHMKDCPLIADYSAVTHG